MRKLLTIFVIAMFGFLLACSAERETTIESETTLTTASLSEQINELSNEYNIALFVTPVMTSSIGINFELPSDTNGYVDYRIAGTTEFTRIKATIKERVISEEETYLFEATITGLNADTTYEYRISNDGSVITSETHTFTTLAENQDEYSLMFLADPQENAETGYMAFAYSVMSVMEYTDKNIQLVMIPGDLVNDNTVKSQWNMFFDYASAFAYNIPIAATIGNHEMPVINGDYLSALEFDGYLNLPNNGPTYQSFDELNDDDRYSDFDDGKTYSFDYGYAHIVVLDSEIYCDGTLACSSSDNENVAILNEWIRNDFEASDAEWKIVMLHRGPYGLTYDTENIRNNLVPVLEECGVDLVLAGHEHQYSRAIYYQGTMIEFGQANDYEYGDLILNSGLSVQWHFNNYNRSMGITYLTSNTTGTKYYGSTASSGIPVNYAFTLEYPVIPIITITADKIEVTSYAVIKESGISIIPTGVFVLEQFQIIK